MLSVSGGSPWARTALEAKGSSWPLARGVEKANRLVANIRASEEKRKTRKRRMGLVLLVMESQVGRMSMNCQRETVNRKNCGQTERSPYFYYTNRPACFIFLLHSLFHSLP